MTSPLESAPFALSIPAPFAASFLNGELALSMCDPINESTGQRVFNVAKWMYFSGGKYLIKSVCDDRCVWSIGKGGLTSLYKVLSTTVEQGVVWSEVFIPEGLLRLDLRLANLSVGESACYVAFSIWKGSSLVYTSNASGWYFSQSVLPDEDVPAPADERRQLPVLSTPINWADGVGERLSWVTDVMPSESVTEQRRGVRRWARRSFEVSFLRRRSHRAQLDVFFAGIGERRFLAPLWHEQHVLPEGLAGIFFTFPEGTVAKREFRVGDLCIITAGDPDDFEILEVATIDLISGLLNFTAPPEKDWPAGSRVMPLRVARFNESPQMSNLTDQVGVARIRVNIDEPEEGPAPDWGYCMPYFHFIVDRSGDVAVTYDKSNFVLDNQASIVEVTDPSEQTQIGTRFQIKLLGRDRAHAFRAFLAAARGRAVAFYMPTHQADVELIEDIAGGLIFRARAAGHTRFVAMAQRARTMIAILPNDGGPAQYRQVMSVAPDDEDPDTGIARTEIFTVDSALPSYLMRNIERIMFVAPSRFDQDAFELQHVVDESCAVLASLAVRATYSGQPRETLVGVTGVSETTYTGYPPIITVDTALVESEWDGLDVTHFLPIVQYDTRAGASPPPPPIFNWNYGQLTFRDYGSNPYLTVEQLVVANENSPTATVALVDLKRTSKSTPYVWRFAVTTGGDIVFQSAPGSYVFTPTWTTRFTHPLNASAENHVVMTIFANQSFTIASVHINGVYKGAIQLNGQANQPTQRYNRLDNIALYNVGDLVPVALNTRQIRVTTGRVYDAANFTQPADLF